MTGVQTCALPISDAQRPLYADNQTTLARLLQKKYLSEVDRRRILACLANLRMVCDGMIAGNATVGAKGFDDLRWIKPVRPGDVLSVESEVREKIEGRRPDIGTVKIESRISNQRGEVVMSLVSLVLYRRRPSGSS